LKVKKVQARTKGGSSGSRKRKKEKEKEEEEEEEEENLVAPLPCLHPIFVHFFNFDKVATPRGGGESWSHDPTMVPSACQAL